MAKTRINRRQWLAAAAGAGSALAASPRARTAPVSPQPRQAAQSSGASRLRLRFREADPRRRLPRNAVRLAPTAEKSLRMWGALHYAQPDCGFFMD